ncbi:molybdenum cofactor biosynthesis protein B [Thermodesulfobacteriota bacterium]
MGPKHHKAKAPVKVKIGIITVSSTRTLENDRSGHWVNKRAQKEKQDVVFHLVIPDETETIIKTVLDGIRDHAPDAILLTGGTGISQKDVTIEAVRPLFSKEMTAFGPIFSQLSFEEIDSAAILSRATAGVIEKTVLFCIPGSLNACKLACKALIFPELGHLMKHLRDG